MHEAMATEAARYWQHAAVPGVDLLRARFVTHRYGRHAHDTYTFALIESGVEEFRYGGSLLRASQGAVLFTLAMSAKAPGASSEPSSVTRAAGMALMKALSKELAPDGIRVNAVLIGLIESGQWARVAGGSGTKLRAFYDRFAEDAGIPLGRFGRAAEFADLGCFLLSSRASYLTGTAINLDGGLSPSV